MTKRDDALVRFLGEEVLGWEYDKRGEDYQHGPWICRRWEAKRRDGTVGPMWQMTKFDPLNDLNDAFRLLEALKEFEIWALNIDRYGSSCVVSGRRAFFGGAVDSEMPIKERTCRAICEAVDKARGFKWEGE